jgi:flagellar protein FlaG
MYNKIGNVLEGSDVSSGMNGVTNSYPLNPSVAGKEQGLSVKKTVEQAAPVSNKVEYEQAVRQGAKVTVGQEQLVRMIDNALKDLQGPSTALEISVHKKTHALLVKVLNQETGEVIREVPPEKTLDLVAKLMESAGILIDERI